LSLPLGENRPSGAHFTARHGDLGPPRPPQRPCRWASWVSRPSCFHLQRRAFST